MLGEVSSNSGALTPSSGKPRIHRKLQGDWVTSSLPPQRQRDPIPSANRAHASTRNNIFLAETKCAADHGAHHAVCRPFRTSTLTTAREEALPATHTSVGAEQGEVA